MKYISFLSYYQYHFFIVRNRLLSPSIRFFYSLYVPKKHCVLFCVFACLFHSLLYVYQFLFFFYLHFIIRLFVPLLLGLYIMFPYCFVVCVCFVAQNINSSTSPPSFFNQFAVFYFESNMNRFDYRKSAWEDNEYSPANSILCFASFPPFLLPVPIVVLHIFHKYDGQRMGKLELTFVKLHFIAPFSSISNILTGLLHRLYSSFYTIWGHPPKIA